LEISVIKKYIAVKQRQLVLVSNIKSQKENGVINLLFISVVGVDK